MLVMRCNALLDAKLRLCWFSQWVGETPIDEVALELEHTLQAAESFQQEARLALVTFVAWAGSARSPARLRALAEEASRSSFYCLQRALGQSHLYDPHRTPPTGRRTPDYRGRVLSLGERKALARRPTREDLDRLVRDPEPAVIEQLLLNPHLTEADLVRLVTAKPQDHRALTHIFADTRWLTSTRVRNGLLLNPTVPLWQSVPLLGLCNRQDLLAVLNGAQLPRELRAAALLHFQRHPPLPLALVHRTIQ